MAEIKRGVSLYSYQQEQFFKRMTWKDMFREVHDNLKCDGIEITDETIIRDYPFPSEQFIFDFNNELARYNLNAVTMDVYFDPMQFRDHVMNYEEGLQRLKNDIVLASRLGFFHHVVREISTDGRLIRDFGNYDKPSDTGMDLGYYKRTRRTRLFPTEPYLGCPPMWMMYEAFRKVKRVGEPFNQPTDIGMTSKGEYIFADGYGNRAVHKFDAAGHFQATYGGVGDYNNLEEDTPGKFLVVHALAVDEKDHIWVCDREKGAVRVLDTEGQVVGYCSGNMGQPSGVDSDGKYIYVIGRGGYLTIFDSDINVVAEIGTFNCDLRAHDCAVDRRGNLYLFPTHATEDHQVICLKRIRE